MIRKEFEFLNEISARDGKYVPPHSTLMSNQTKVRKTKTGPLQGDKAWSRDPISALFEILQNKEKSALFEILKSMSIMGSLFSFELTSDLSSSFKFCRCYQPIIIIQLHMQVLHFRIQAR